MTNPFSPICETGLKQRATIGHEISNLSSYNHIEGEMTTFVFSKLISVYYGHLLYVDNFE